MGKPSNEHDDKKAEGAAETPVSAQTEIEKLRQEVGEAKDKYIRLFAEFDNVRKRNERDRAALIKYAHEEVIIEMLGFYEDFERCVEAGRKSSGDNGAAALLKGVEMTLKRMQELLKKYDVKVIDALGKKFDHNLHEALMMVESSEYDDNTVIEVFQNGYTLGDRVVRPAKVKVARRPASPEAKPKDGEANAS